MIDNTPALLPLASAAAGLASAAAPFRLIRQPIACFATAHHALLRSLDSQRLVPGATTRADAVVSVLIRDACTRLSRIWQRTYRSASRSWEPAIHSINILP